MAIANSMGLTSSTSGLVTWNGNGIISSTAPTNHGIMVGTGGLTITSVGPGSTGQVLQANTSGDPSFSTATYPSTATSTGQILRANGTNWASTSDLVVSSSGNVTQPRNACVFAYVHNGGANITNATGDGTTYTIIFDTTSVDANTNFNTGTGTFTAPVAGNYLITSNVTFTNLGAGHTNAQIYININGAIMKNQFNPVLDAVSGTYTSTISAIYPVAASAPINIQAIVSGSTKTVGFSYDNFGFYTYVSIALLG